MGETIFSRIHPKPDSRVCGSVALYAAAPRGAERISRAARILGALVCVQSKTVFYADALRYAASCICLMDWGHAPVCRFAGIQSEGVWKTASASRDVLCRTLLPGGISISTDTLLPDRFGRGRHCGLRSHAIQFDEWAGSKILFHL